MTRQDQDQAIVAIAHNIVANVKQQRKLALSLVYKVDRATIERLERAQSRLLALQNTMRAVVLEDAQGTDHETTQG